MIRHLGMALALLLTAQAAAKAETLGDALIAGIEKSDALMAARQSYVASREAIAIARSGNDLTGTVTVTGAQTESDKKSASGGFQSSQSFSARIGVSKQLYDSGEADARVMAAEYGIASSKASYRAIEQATILSIIDAYLTLITSSESRALQQENVARLTAQTEATKVRLDAGTTTATRLAEAQARLARAQSNLISAQANEQTALETYQSLTGLGGTNLSLPSLGGALPANLQEAEDTATTNHPDMQVAIANERSMRAQFDVLARQVMPKVKFTLSATDSQAKGTMQDKLDIKGELSLTSPFLVTQGSRAKGKETFAKLERAKYQLADTRRKVGLNARSALRSLKAAKSQKEAVEAELSAAILVAEGISAEVEFGQKIFLDQLDAEQSVSDARVRKLQAEQSIMINHYRLLSAIGMLDYQAVGLSETIQPLESTPDPRDVFTGFLPLADLPQ
ncbi:MAG: TolC family protein [Candidatus Puniceispirillaceae bacterium]